MKRWGRRVVLGIIGLLLLALLVWAFLPQPVDVDIAPVTRGTCFTLVTSAATSAIPSPACHT